MGLRSIKLTPQKAISGRRKIFLGQNIIMATFPSGSVVFILILRLDHL